MDVGKSLNRRLAIGNNLSFYGFVSKAIYFRNTAYRNEIWALKNFRLRQRNPAMRNKSGNAILAQERIQPSKTMKNEK